MHLQMPVVVQNARMVENLLKAVQEFHAAHHLRNQQFMTRFNDCKERLIAGWARS